MFVPDVNCLTLRLFYEDKLGSGFLACQEFVNKTESETVANTAVLIVSAQRVKDSSFSLNAPLLPGASPPLSLLFG